MEGSTFLSHHHLSHPSLNLLLIDQTGNPTNLHIYFSCKSQYIFIML